MKSCEMCKVKKQLVYQCNELKLVPLSDFVC